MIMPTNSAATRKKPASTTISPDRSGTVGIIPTSGLVQHDVDRQGREARSCLLA